MVAAVAALVLGPALALGGCALPDPVVPTGPRPSSPTATPTPSRPPLPPTPSPTHVPLPTLLEIYVVGDSLTSGAEQSLVPDDYTPDQWPGYLGERVRVVGSYAVPGVTTDEMLAGVGPSDADCLVIMAGENDDDTGRDPYDVVGDLDAIVETVGTPRVLVVGVTPTNYDLDTRHRVNELLELWARDRHYEYVDASVDVRDDDGAWLPGMSPDGTHPSPEAARLIAATVEKALVG